MNVYAHADARGAHSINNLQRFISLLIANW